MFGVLFGFISLSMLWTIFFTTLTSGIKLTVFGLGSLIALTLQRYALTEFNNSGFWQAAKWERFNQEVRNYKWFGLFFLGAISPYILALFFYVLFMNL